MTYLSTRTQEWRDRADNLCIATVLSATVTERLMDGPDLEKETADAFINALKDWGETYYDNLIESLKYKNAFKMSYIRNFMWAIWKYETNGGNDYEGVFMKAFTDIFFSRVDQTLRTIMDEEQVSQEHKEGTKLDKYMHLLSFYYINRLANMADDGDRKPVSDNSPEHHKLLQLHRQLEAEGQFDEILMIRLMLIHLVAGAYDMHINGDEAAFRVFKIDAFEMLNEMNSKPVMVA